MKLRALWSRVRGLHPAGRRTVGSRISLNLAVVGLIGILAVGLFLAQMILTNFRSLEREQINDHLSRSSAFMAEARSSMESKTKDWAYWDDTYQYVQDFNTAFADENLNLEAMQNYAVDGFAIVRYQDLKTNGMLFDFEQGAVNVAKTAEIKALARSPDVIARVKHTKLFQQYAKIGGRLVLASVAEIKRSDYSGAPYGYLVFVRAFDEAALSDAMQLPSRIEFANLSHTSHSHVHFDHIDVSKAVIGTDGKPIAALTFKVERTMLQRGWEMLGIALASIGIMLVAMVLLINQRVHALVAVPLAAFRSQVDRIRETGDLSQIQETDRSDEIGTLQRAFNSMARELDTLRAQNEAQSFAIGKNQSAIGVMHNVRNGLSPMNVFLSRLGDELSLPAMPHVRQALAELSRGDVPEERRAKLASFFAMFLDRIEQGVVHKRDLLGNARQTVESVLEAIDQVQHHDKASEFDIESCDIHAIICQSGKLLDFDSDNPVDLMVAESQPIAVRGNRILVGQIVGNLFNNAIEAIAAHGAKPGRIDVAFDVDASQGVCEIRIRDNGEGFAPELSKRLFERGYSTRPARSGGLGLHWCANSINAMKGSLALESEGPGRGAVAVLRLPLAGDRGASQDEPEAIAA